MEKKEYINLWIKKANDDLKVAERELKYSDPVLDAVCFHLQQCVEKYLKAFLIYNSKVIIKTHNIEFLLEKCIQIDIDYKKYEEKFDILSQCGVETRYPDSFVILKKDDIKKVLIIVKNFVKHSLAKLKFE